ncbi:DBF4-type zinc finger-containing protein 2 [Latimeria chalumnae]|uniref:DBF4-type zinc finger-containing protein 2 n=1 Tax=Latimeria chalumnae TaxID=7897 RepID=UPI0003C13C76|nr:PREDICTED: DBF4-type zinc finger-containing protein 2 [Latimeria chalumnae]XP_014353805.1 PREDICTED: DBF4-type zinc finger-containing protein 2 [Latimeria chalumnae]|eukprot:XP_006012055.1 PREDICTED: DBF4-type zinc finger-containing protein 2 [Latimeria chalumnae]
MFDKSKRADDQSVVSGQERRTAEYLLKTEDSNSLSIGCPEQPGPGTSSMQSRQGYCSCCQVLYSNLEQHVQCSQHRQRAGSSRNRIVANSLMERFLQDVMHHHPVRYDDSRPTYDDLPSIKSPLIPNDDITDEYSLCEDDRQTVGTREEVPSTSQQSVQMPHSKVIKFSKGGSQAICGTTLAPLSSKALGKGDKLDAGSFFHSQHASCSIQSPSALPGILLRTSSNAASEKTRGPLPQNSLGNSIIAENRSCCKGSSLKHSSCCNKPGQLERLPCSCDTLVCQKPKSSLFQIPSCAESSSLNPSSGVPFPKHYCLKSQDVTTVSQPSLRDFAGASHSYAAVGLHLGTEEYQTKQNLVCQKHWDSIMATEDPITRTIEAVIQKYCYGVSAKSSASDKTESSFDISLGSLVDGFNYSDSNSIFDWETSMRTEADQLKQDTKCLEWLKEAHIMLEDEKYETQLDSVLKVSQEKDEIEFKSEKNNIVEEKVPPSPYVPPTFVGKTWSQIMYEDDLKIEALVREFREGHFRSYFDSDSLANFGRRSSKKLKDKAKIGDDPSNESSPKEAAAEALPSYDGNSDHSVLSDTIHKPAKIKSRSRTWCLASRCQVVKVSHGTQTSLLNWPVVKKKVVRKEEETIAKHALLKGLECEKTPDMKTRLCALKLPESYSKIMNPLQPKTLVYVLPPPELKPRHSVPTCLAKSERNRKSVDSSDSIKYKYKRSLLQYYDPLTNRILKMPPKGLIEGKSKKKLPCVRQLFRSLSPDINMERQTVIERDYAHSKKRTESLSSVSAKSLVSFCPSKEKRKEDHSRLSPRVDIFSEKKPSVPAERSHLKSLSRPESSCKHFVISPINRAQLRPKRGTNLSPLKDRISGSLPGAIKRKLQEKENPKTKKRKSGFTKELSFTVRNPRLPSTGRQTLRKQLVTEPSKGARRMEKQRNSSSKSRSKDLALGGFKARKRSGIKLVEKERPKSKTKTRTEKSKKKLCSVTAIKSPASGCKTNSRSVARQLTKVVPKRREKAAYLGVEVLERRTSEISSRQCCSRSVRERAVPERNLRSHSQKLKADLLSKKRKSHLE